MKFFSKKWQKNKVEGFLWYFFETQVTGYFGTIEPVKTKQNISKDRNINVIYYICFKNPFLVAKNHFWTRGLNFLHF